MLRSVVIFLLSLAPWQQVISTELHSLDASDSVPNRTTASEMAEAWARFHESSLCRGLDAAFVFHERAMEITGTILDEKSFEKFQELLRPLKATYAIEIHLARLKDEEEKTGEKKDDEKHDDPPASLWENDELRSFLGDPFSRARERAGFDDDLQLRFPPPDEILKQRLRVFAEQTLAWNSEIERYAKHLPALVQMATDPGLKQRLRMRANAAAMEHAKEIDRLVGKLGTSLAPAFPHSRKVGRITKPEKHGMAEKAIADRAAEVSEFAQSVSLRVYHFIYPEQYTVGLDELRQPGLLVSLKELQKRNEEFLKTLAKSK